MNEYEHKPERVIRMSEAKQGVGEEVIPSEKALDMMWQLARDAWTFTGSADAESRLQRHVVRLVRGKG